MPKFIVTIPLTYDFEKDNYKYVYDAEGNNVELSDEQVEGLSEEDMIEYDRRNMSKGEFNLEDFLSYGDYDLEEVKIEPAKEDDGA